MQIFINMRDAEQAVSLHEITFACAIPEHGLHVTA